ncbi:MAG: haloacid dehalogenase type II [Devosia sp.]
MPIRALLFDVYGTLLDVHGLTAALEQAAPGQGAGLSALWRQKQIDYTRLRTLSGRHADFAQVTADGLDFAAEKLGVTLSAAQRDALLAGYETLPAHDDALPALTALVARGGLTLGVLSNGTPQMLERGLAAVGLTPLLPHRLSIEAAGKYKTAPEAYQLGPDALGLPVGEIGFVSSNGWDACCATWFGYRAIWVNRRREPLERLGVVPEREARGLGEVVEWVGA